MAFWRSEIERNRMIVQMYSDGYTMATVAAAFDTTKQNVSLIVKGSGGRGRSLNPPKPIDAALRATIIREYKYGASRQQIMTLFDVYLYDVFRITKSIRRPRATLQKYRTARADADAVLKQAKECGMSRKDIAEAAGVTQAAVSYWHTRKRIPRSEHIERIKGTIAKQLSGEAIATIRPSQRKRAS